MRLVLSRKSLPISVSSRNATHNIVHTTKPRIATRDCLAQRGPLRERGQDRRLEINMPEQRTTKKAPSPNLSAWASERNRQKNYKELRCEYNSKAIADFKLLGAFNSSTDRLRLIFAGVAGVAGVEPAQGAVGCPLLEDACDSSRCVKFMAHFSDKVSVNSFRRYKNATLSVMPFSLVQTLWHERSITSLH